MEAQLEALLAGAYGLRKARAVNQLDTKGQREAYLLESERGRLVVKLTDPGRPKHLVAGDTGILAYLERFDFPAPRMCRAIDGSLFLPYGPRFVYLYEYVEGKMPVPSAWMLGECGSLLARLHSLPLDGTARRSLHRPANLIEEIRPWIDAAPQTPEQQAIAAEMRCLVEAFPSFEGLPESLIHTDPYFTNLLEGVDGRLYLIDWEDGGISYPLLDIGYLGHLVTCLPHDRAVLGLDGVSPVSWRPDWAQAFLDGYQSVRTVSSRERELFSWAVRLNFMMYLWDWEEARFLPENFRRMKILEGFRPNWG